MKKRTVSTVIVLVMSVCALLALLTALTFSWFITAQEAMVAPTNVDVTKLTNLYIGTSVSGKFQWGSQLEVTSVFEMKPITGNGKVFFRENVVDFEETLYEEETLTVYGLSHTEFSKIPTADLDEYVLSSDFKLSYSTTGKLYLDPASEMIPMIEDSPASSYMPDVSTAYIAGALRAAILQKNAEGGYDLKCVWMPNATFEYQTTGPSFRLDGEVEKNYTFVNDNKRTNDLLVSTEDCPEGGKVVDGVLYVWDLQTCAIPFAEISSGSSEDFRIAIWLEGTDRECVNALAGGRIRLNLGILAGT